MFEIIMFLIVSFVVVSVIIHTEEKANNKKAAETLKMIIDYIKES